jgi:hypothetical protein
LELRKQYNGQLKRNGFHVLQAIPLRDDLADYFIKFACVHEAIGSDSSVYAQLIDATVVKDGANRVLSDEEACRVVRFLLDNRLLERFPGLFYQACRAGWRQCAAMLFSEGVYRPLAWHRYSGDSPARQEAFLRILLEVANPSIEDLRIIRGGFEEGGIGASLVDRAVAQRRMH